MFRIRNCLAPYAKRLMAWRFLHNSTWITDRFSRLWSSVRSSFWVNTLPNHWKCKHSLATSTQALLPASSRRCFALVSKLDFKGRKLCLDWYLFHLELLCFLSHWDVMDKTSGCADKKQNVSCTELREEAIHSRATEEQNHILRVVCWNSHVRGRQFHPFLMSVGFLKTFILLHSTSKSRFLPLSIFKDCCTWTTLCMSESRRLRYHVIITSSRQCWKSTR